MRTILSAAIVVAGLALAGPAWAHAHLVTADPPGGGTTAPPDTLKHTFSEGLEIAFCKIEVTDDAGADKGPAKVALDPGNAKLILVTLPAKLAAGGYKVHWHVVSEDTHHTEGTFPFTVK